MPDFGFKISKDRQINYDDNSRSLFMEVAAFEPSVYSCISCGTCSATCSAAQFTTYSLHKIILLLKRGEDKEVISNISKCMFAENANWHVLWV
ncbi:MAG: (4Fe-4S)-binding protein [Bacteroidetes bacterium]|nr:(4Fe-4S)-binding protein [Bacteroidota bacterium]